MVESDMLTTKKKTDYMRIAVIIPSLAGGGMERMRMHLIQEWVRKGIHVDLVVSRFQGPLSDSIPGKVNVFEIAGSRPYLFPFNLYRYLKTRKPTHVLSATDDLNAITILIVMLSGNNIPVVISFHNHLSSKLKLANGLEKLKLHIVILMLKRLIPYCHGIISVSQGVADDLRRYFYFNSDVCHVVYNPVITEETSRRIQEPLKGCPVPNDIPWILFAGRFVHAKGIDILVDGFERIVGKTPAHLVLIGHGPVKHEIIAKIEAKGLSERVHLMGFQSNPLPWMREASVFVLPSRHEGLPNVIIEALACGTQVIATDCPSGPSEILESGKYGQLVSIENPDMLSKAILKSLNKDFFIPIETLRVRADEFTASKAAMSYLSHLNSVSRIRG